MATTAKKSTQVLDGSDISDLVNNKQVFSKFIDEKFQQLDQNHDGKLSVKELEPAVAEIGAALGLPAQGSSSDSDHIYSEVLNEFTHGKEKQVSKSEFQEVLSDILLGMAAGLKRDPIVILRIDGDDLIEFVNSSRFISETLVIFSEIKLEEDESLRNCITKALEKLTVDHGMPPASDSWVFNNIIEPALEANSALLNKTPISQESFLKTLKKVTESIADHLKERPVIVAHSGNTFDGSGIKRLLSNKFEADKVLDSAWKSVPKDRHGKFSREYLRVALDDIAPAAGLPPFGAVDQMDELLKEVFKMVKADEGTSLQEEEFKKVLLEILGSLMLQLESNPISVSSNSVVNEPDTSSSTLFPPLHQNE